MGTNITTASTKIQCSVSENDHLTISGIKRNYAAITTTSLGLVNHIVLDEGRAQILINTLKEHFDL